MKVKVKLVDYESIFFIANSLNLYIKAGISIRKAIEIIENTIKNKEYKEAVRRMGNSIDLGEGLGAAFLKERMLFTDHFVDMIVMAEESGKLEEILLVLANHFEKNNKMRKTVKKSLSYPILLIGTMVTVFTLIIIFVIPTLADMYGEVGGDLSIFTKTMLFINNMVEKINPLLVIVSLIAIGILLFFILKDLLKNKDLFGNIGLVKDYREIKFILLIKMMIKGGVPITSAAMKLKESITDKYLKCQLIALNNSLNLGLSLTESMESTESLSELSKSFLYTGEESGSLEETIEKLADILDYQFNSKLNKAIFYIEPAAILILGIMVLALVLMVFIPMYEYMSYV